MLYIQHVLGNSKLFVETYLLLTVLYGPQPQIAMAAGSELPAGSRSVHQDEYGTHSVCKWNGVVVPAEVYESLIKPWRGQSFGKEITAFINGEFDDLAIFTQSVGIPTVKDNVRTKITCKHDALISSTVSVGQLNPSKILMKKFLASPDVPEEVCDLNTCTIWVL